jgi:2-polyprenyl-3-methyl-5-hydroxy-6-metoxy-1,4-benzoquinol methylase
MVGQGKRVLEIGAGPGSITRLLSEHGKCRVTAAELDGEAIVKLRPFCERVYQCDLNSPNWSNLISADEKFEVVVAADVLEHLYDPWSTLRTVITLLGADGYIVISLPHIGHEAVLASLYSGDFSYHEWGLLDRTHIRFFGIRTMQRLCEEAGLKIVDADYLVRNPDQTEFAKSWASAPDDLKRTLAKGPFGRIYQVVIKAVPRSAPGRALDLASLPVPSPGPLMPHDASIATRVRIGLKLASRRVLSQQARAHISQMLLRLGVRF